MQMRERAYRKESEGTASTAEMLLLPVQGAAGFAGSHTEKE
jgi:hypothetical protein